MLHQGRALVMLVSEKAGRTWWMAVFAMLACLVGIPVLSWAQDATSVATAYRDIPQLGGSRNIIWVIAQQDFQQAISASSWLKSSVISARPPCVFSFDLRPAIE